MFQHCSANCTRRVLCSLEPDQTTSPPSEPRWLVTINILALVSLYLALPERLTLGPT